MSTSEKEASVRGPPKTDEESSRSHFPLCKQSILPFVKAMLALRRC